MVNSSAFIFSTRVFQISSPAVRALVPVPEAIVAVPRTQPAAMLNIMSMKKKGDGGGPKKQKISAAQIRLQKDLADMDKLPRTMTLTFPNPDDMFNFGLTIAPDEGFYKSGTFRFTIYVNANYPHEPPKVLCTQKIYHPNIDLEGNVCLNILREDWKPVLNINSIIVGLQYLFLEPNADDPLNKEAAEVLRSNRRLFEQNVTKTMKGDALGYVNYDCVV